ncbi:MAG TPA: hypothetical protein VHO50_13965 [Bacteroidales bacterium]|nr:hypothetical protein [Bacteroidales bacterium]
MKSKSNFVVVFSLIVFVNGACNKEAEPDTSLPSNASESFELVTKKWDFTGPSVYSSIELTKDTVYVVRKSGSAKSADSDIISGRFTISADGKTITLTGFGTMTIKSVSSNTIFIDIIIDNSSTTISLAGTQNNEAQNELAGSTWITGTLNDSLDGSAVAKKKFYLKIKFITSSYMEVWNCYYDGTSELNMPGGYSYDDIKGGINDNIFKVSPIEGITRVYKKIYPATTNQTSGSITGTEWRTGTLIENSSGTVRRYYLKMTVSNDAITIWDCNYNGTSQVNTTFPYTQNGNKILQNGIEIAKIDHRALTVEPAAGITRIFAKQ